MSQLPYEGDLQVQFDRDTLHVVSNEFDRSPLQPRAVLPNTFVLRFPRPVVYSCLPGLRFTFGERHPSLEKHPYPASFLGDVLPSTSG